LCARPSAWSAVSPSNSRNYRCVEATARDAADYDYYVVVLGDASGAVRDELHQASLYTIRTYIGRVAESADVARLWAERR